MPELLASEKQRLTSSKMFWSVDRATMQVLRDMAAELLNLLQLRLPAQDGPLDSPPWIPLMESPPPPGESYAHRG